MSVPWSEPEIERRAAELAPALRQVAAAAHNEAELRLGAVPLLRQFTQELDLPIEDRHEYTVGRGRADSVFGGVVVEFEAPRSLRESNSATANRKSIRQAQQYAEDMSNRDRQELSRILAVSTDGERIIFVRHRAGDWDVSQPRPVDAASVAHLLFCLKSLQSKALLPETLAEEFGADPDGIAGQCVQALYRAHEHSSSPKVDALFEQWRLLFSEVCGYELKSPKGDLPRVAERYGLHPKRLDAARLFFSIHSYYATLIKLLAAEIVTFYQGQMTPSYLGRLEGLGADPLRQELATLEEGGIFAQQGVRNFLEGDFFAWYLEVWNDALASAIGRIVRALRDYDPATVQVDPEQTRDLLKKLYQDLLPKKLRHDLGEYYTPDWLAELVLEEIGYDGDLSKRILDPACGSGTFLVLEIKRAREWAQNKFLPERETLDRILNGIVGFDLNPLAVITARTNYLMALGKLLRERRGDIEIPVYLCDSVLTPTEARQLTTGGRHLPLVTSVGTFEIPVAVATRERVSALAGLLEQAVRGRYPAEDFLARAKAELRLEPAEYAEAHHHLAALYERLRDVDAQRRNGIWARIIKNFFAPVFAGRFDFVAANPPWINWQSLPSGYRKSTARLWEHYGMSAKAGKEQFELGKVKRDLSALFLYVAADKYLTDDGRLGFLITESVLRSGAAEGFRRFELPAKPGQWRGNLRVLTVHDLVEVKPFEGATNRTAAICLEKGKPTSYPVPYVAWRRRRAKSLTEEMTLAQARQAAIQERHLASPVSGRRAAPWISGPTSALEAVQKAVGKSDYKARAGVCTWLNGVYWIRVLEVLPDGKLLVENLYDVGRAVVRRAQAPVEPDLVYPLLRGRDVTRWATQRTCSIIVPHTLDTEWQAISESEMRNRCPHTLDYLRGFERQLLGRSGYRQLRAGHPFYILGNIGKHTFADYKVVWPGQVATSLRCALLCAEQGRPTVPDQTVYYLAFQTAIEGHFLASLLNSAPVRAYYAFRAYKHTSMAFVGDLALPRFGAKNALHQRLAELSEAAHQAAARDDAERVAEIEAQVDEAAAQLWDITPRELKTIQKALRARQPAGRRAVKDAD